MCYQPNPNINVNDFINIGKFENNEEIQTEKYEKITNTELYYFIGKLMGKAIIDEQLLDAHYKHMLGMPVTFHDLLHFDRIYYNSLLTLLQNSLITIGMDYLTFSIEETIKYENNSSVIIIDLIENGRNISVTDENKLNYVRLMAYHYLSKSFRSQMDSFLNGFHSILPADIISFFEPIELELLICGLPDIDINDMREHTTYSEYESTDNEIIWFWEIVETFTNEEKAFLLQFITGCSKVPIEGFGCRYHTHVTCN